ncbi:hypothetical protein GCM10010833_26440 [Blastomonas aquatica]|uniref:Uncharacterized protein n=1 Tax=Blastomonas aquatica TaxID=1510276 RepID=A0ABQ1JN05_9SPHN|nr:hypothetical protein GCM10010833_26440 [Blastomonas aquatica]
MLVTQAQQIARLSFQQVAGLIKRISGLIDETSDDTPHPRQPNLAQR